MTVSAGEHNAVVSPLSWGQCQTVRLPIPANEKPQFTFTRTDGSLVYLRSLPLPTPKVNERYVPFGDEMVLTGANMTSHGGATALNLVRPLERKECGRGGMHARTTCYHHERSRRIPRPPRPFVFSGAMKSRRSFLSVPTARTGTNAVGTTRQDQVRILKGPATRGPSLDPLRRTGCGRLCWRNAAARG